MKILVACEKSGRVRDAFRRRGHDAISCDILPSDAPGPHICGSLEDVIGGQEWEMIIAFPPCRFLCSSGLWRNRKTPGRAEKTEYALAFVQMILSRDCPRIVLENSVGCISTRIRKPSQSIQPYEFYEDASKRTCLWLKGVPLLKKTKRFPGRMVEYPPGSGKIVERWSNQTDSGQNRLGPSDTRAADRAVTYLGVAEAMAEQWGNLSS